MNVLYIYATRPHKNEGGNKLHYLVRPLRLAVKHNFKYSVRLLQLIHAVRVTTLPSTLLHMAMAATSI